MNIDKLFNFDTVSLKTKIVALLVAFALIVFGSVAAKQMAVAAAAKAAAEAKVLSEEEAAAKEKSEIEATYDELGYGELQRQVANTLSEGVYADKSNMRMEFSSNSWKKIKSGEVSSEGEYCIGIAQVAEDHSSATGINNYTITFVIRDPGKDTEEIATLSQEQHDSGVDGPWVLNASMFNSEPLTQYVEVGDVEIEGFDERLTALLGDTGSTQVKENLASFVKRTFATAKVIKFDGKATVDFTKEIVEMTFTVDNRASTALRVTYNMNTGEMKVW